MKLGFIGCGNMATAIINGVLNNKLVENTSIHVFDTYQGAVDKIVNDLGVHACKSSADVMNESDILFLAVKPNVIANVLTEIDGANTQCAPLIVSIAAGKSVEYLESCTKNKFRIIRVMPNINAKVGEAISAYCFNTLATDEDKSNVEKLLSCFGKCLCIDEGQFPIFGVIGGCAPAYAYIFIDALARAGVKNGMKKDEALKIAAQTVYGSAKMILEGDEHPWKLVDNVCSPGGTTIEGVLSLQSDGFEAAIHNAVQRAFDKDSKL